MQPNGGLQLYVEILDKDRSSAILVDRFAIDITPPVDITVSGRQTYSGVFGLAEMDLTIGLESTQATEGYRSADYNNGHQCVDWENSFTCDCRESFTGPPCADIDFCAGPAVCKLNRSCPILVCVAQVMLVQNVLLNWMHVREWTVITVNAVPQKLHLCASAMMDSQERTAKKRRHLNLATQM